MSHSRKRIFAGQRCPGHDYYSRCIYHIVLNKALGIPDFSSISGIPGNRQWPPHINLSPWGEAIASALSNIKNHYPFTSILRRAIMPDHVHFAIFIKEETDIHLGTIIKDLKIECSENMKDLITDRSIQIPSLSDTDSLLPFIPGYNDTFLSGKNQLSRMLNYISDNPRRYLIRRDEPGWFRKFIISDGDISLNAYGNWDLLEEAILEPVKISRKYTLEETISHKRKWLQTIRNDGVLVSPFINPEEKKVRDWTLQNGGAVILIIPTAFEERYKPQGQYFDACAEGRLLIISDPDDNFVGTRQFESYTPSRQTCLRLNQLAESIAYGAFHRF